ncbi:MAG: polysaccharide biosynthesis protein [Cryomorphaceae bacterium]|nr:polysaccharide biosynthesis protein [Cryomorphaceae bacterium]
MKQQLQVLVKFFSDKFLSRWAVLAIDLFIVFISTLLAFIVWLNFEFTSFQWGHIFFTSILSTIIAAIFFLVFSSHISIIRHTSMRDAVRVFEAMTLSAIVLAFIAFFDQEIMDIEQIVIPLSVVVIFYLTTMFLLVFFRISVKHVYHVMHGTKDSYINTLIFGAGQLGMVAKSTLVNGGSTKYLVVGFVDENVGKIGKTLEGIKVYHPNEITAEFIQKKRIKEIVFAVQNIDVRKKRELIDGMIKFDVVVKSIPPVDGWINGELNLKQIQRVRKEDLLQREPIKMNNPRVKSFIDGKVVMVTGAAGSIGSELVRQLVLFKAGKLILLDQAETPLFELKLELSNKFINHASDLECIIADVSQGNRMEAIFKAHRPQLVFHAAAYKHVPMMEENPLEAVRVNVFGTRLLADLSVKYAVEKFIMISTDKAVKPTNVMGATKRFAEIAS